MLGLTDVVNTDGADVVGFDAIGLVDGLAVFGTNVIGLADGLAVVGAISGHVAAHQGPEDPVGACLLWQPELKNIRLTWVL